MSTLSDKGDLVSILIPMRNEARYVRACLDSVLAQSFPKTQMEVFCIDGRSTDGTRSTVDEYAAKHRFIRVLDNPARIVPVGLNQALGETAGQVIVRLDAHASYPVDYVAKCVEVLRRAGADNVGGTGTLRRGARGRGRARWLP